MMNILSVMNSRVQHDCASGSRNDGLAFLEYFYVQLHQLQVYSLLNDVPFNKMKRLDYSCDLETKIKLLLSVAALTVWYLFEILDVRSTTRSLASSSTPNSCRSKSIFHT